MSKKQHWLVIVIISLYLTFMLSILLGLLLLDENKTKTIVLKQEPTTVSKVVEDILNASVMVDAGEGNGSGVIYKNRHTSFVWTAGHVVELVKEPHVPLHEARWADCWVKQLIVQNGRNVGEHKYLAEVIKVSLDEDIAILRIRKEDWEGKSVKFAKNLPLVGERVYHVGSMAGVRGTNSVTDGLVNFVGRLRFEGLENNEIGQVYDQISVNSYYGSSGGGVFRENGECLGLLNEFLTSKTTGNLSCMVPTRRLLDFAVKNNCQWALDDSFSYNPYNFNKILVDKERELKMPEPPKVPPAPKKEMPPPSPPLIK